MFEKLRAYIEEKTHLSEEQYEIIRSHMVQRTLKKGEYLQRSGEISKYGVFVAKGLLRSYTIDGKGKEHIVQFIPENWWFSDLTSARTQQPSLYFVDALEPSDILISDFVSYEKVMAAVPEFASLYQKGLQKHLATKDKRIVASLSATAEDRYLEFMKTYPSIALRVPQHMLASYLGITPETLSRIRKLKL